MKCPEQANPQRQKTDHWSLGAGGGGKCGVTDKGHDVAFEGDENVLKLDRG